jgi:hypothetical protein
MYTIFHFKSAEEINTDIVDAIKLAFKSKPVTITVEEESDETAFLLANSKNREILMESIAHYKKNELISIQSQLNEE